MITVNFTFSSLAEAVKTLARLDSGTNTAVVATIQKAEPAKVEVPKQEKAAKAEKPAATPAAPATVTPTPEATAPAATATESPSKVEYSTVKNAVLEVVKAKGAEAAGALLAEFGAKKGPDLKEDQYPAVVARATELLAA